MKRFIAVTAIVAAIVAPAVAGAGPRLAHESLEGASKRGGLSVVFTVYKLGNKPVGVDNFQVENLDVDCNQGPGELDFRLKIKGEEFFKVNDRKRFRAVSTKGPRTLKVLGEFVTNNKVEGKVKAEGKFQNGTLTGCSGAAQYVAG